MSPHLSAVGQQMSRLTGVRAIMQDIIETLQTQRDGAWINLSAGNPVILPEIEQMWRRYTLDLLDQGDFGEVICRYGSSQGYEPFIDAVVAWFRDQYGWPLTRQHVLITPGSQALYFYAANCFGGPTAYGEAGGEQRSIVLPLSPDYTGYGGVGLRPGMLRAYRPTIESLPGHRFKYRPDFDRLQLDAGVGAVLFSRPCNPTGNVLSDGEVNRLVQMAAVRNIPVLIDSAYAPPFPNLAFAEMTPIWAENVIHCLSLSKAGLPGERLGVAIGHPDWLRPLQAFQANAAIHSSRFGQAIAAPAIASGDLARLAKTVIQPHYQHKMACLEAALDREMPDVPWALHKGEGAIFAWLWFDQLPLTDGELYERIKQEGVIVVPGASFFPGLSGEDWPHQRQCLRLSLTATVAELEAGVRAIANVVAQVYQAVPV